MSTETDIFKDLVLDLIDKAEWDEVRTQLDGQHAADIAELLRETPEDHRAPLFTLLDDDTKPDVLAELETHQRAELLTPLHDSAIATIISAMEPDDATDILNDFEVDRAQAILAGMEAPESHELRQLLRYDEESAGGIMTTILARFSANMTIAQAIEQMAYLDIEEPIYNIYITDDDGVLIGTVGLWELLRERNRERPLGEIAHPDPVTVHTDVDQEEIAALMSKYDLNALPVLNYRNQLVGRITVDDVMDVMTEEASEDIMRMAGTSDRELAHSNALQVCRARLPWLLITLGTGFITSFVFKEFIAHLSDVLVLSFFVPIVMAMGGNTGIQSSTLIIRRLSLGTLEAESLRRILLREFFGALLMGLICASVITVWAAYLAQHSDHPASLSPYFLGGVVGLSLISAMVFAAVFGAFVPILLDKLRIDPAVASGPFVTSSNDIFALLIYYAVTFGLVAWAMGLGGAGG
jgi:magnesium transporter